MESLYILIPIGIIFVLVALAIFIWAVRSNQFDDLERHGMTILFEEENITHKNKEEKNVSNIDNGI